MGRFTRVVLLGSLALGTSIAATPTCGQSSQAAAPLPDAAQTVHIVQAAVAAELHLLDEDSRLPMRFMVRRTDAKGTTLRQVFNTTGGAIAHLISRNGKPLSADEASAERERLQDLLASPAMLERSRKRSAEARSDSAALIRALPDALIFTSVPGQPRRPAANAAEYVFDFAPNPAFHPPTLASEALTGIAGRLWIDQRSGYLTHLEGRFTRTADIGMGLLVRIYAGGTVTFTQVQIAPDHWSFQRVDSHLTVRELLVRTQQRDVQLEYGDYAVLPSPVTPEQAVRMLLGSAAH